MNQVKKSSAYVSVMSIMMCRVLFMTMMKDFGNGGIPHLAWMLEQHKSMLPEIPAGSRIGCPVARPSKIICIGLNYSDHAKETGMAIPAEPIIFMKSTTALSALMIISSFRKILSRPIGEVELAVVIEKSKLC